MRNVGICVFAEVEVLDFAGRAGISAGLDLSLHVIARLVGRELVIRTARPMDYPWRD